MFTELINFESSSFEIYLLFISTEFFKIFLKNNWKCMLIPNQMLNNQFLTVLFFTGDNNNENDIFFWPSWYEWEF